MEKLALVPTLTKAVNRGLANLVPLIVNGLLWALTAWIPYLNVGTTIGLFVGVTAKMARGETLSMTEIFNPDYRKQMGSFFLVSGLVTMGTLASAFLMFVPALVLGLAWSLATLLVVDKGVEPMAAIHKSNELTYGFKAKMFWTSIVLTLAFGIAAGILFAIGNFIHEILGVLLAAAVYLILMSSVIALNSVYYEELTEGKL